MIRKKAGMYPIIALFALSLLIAHTGALVMKEYLNTNLPGSDYSTIPAPTKEECAFACMADGQCMASTWVSALGEAPVCHLKNAVPPITPQTGGMTTTMDSYIKDVNATTTTLATGCPALSLPDFTAEPSAGTAPLSVHFADRTNGITQAFWDYGDGSSSTGGLHSGFSHTYSAAGSYTMRLTVYDACGHGITAAKTITVSAPAGGYGSLRVDTTPSGALVYIDGTPVGATPVSVTSGLAAGTHNIRIVLAGYNDYSEDETLTAGQEIALQVTLTPSSGGLAYRSPQPYSTGDASLKNALKNTPPAQSVSGGQVPAPGTLIVSSSPAGANVYVDGKSAGKTPVTIPDMPAGQHTLLLTLPGYADVSRSIDVSTGAENQVAIDFTGGKKTPGFGGIICMVSLALLVLYRKREG